MNTLTFKYRKNAKKAAFEALKAGMENQSLIEKNILYFDDLDSMFSFMTGSRAKIIQTIQEQKPHSIYELAKILDLNQSYVLKEFKFLERLGIVKGESKETSGRKTIFPTTKYDHFVIDWDVVPKKGTAANF
jgi:predicted transcriptional regulator